LFSKLKTFFAQRGQPVFAFFGVIDVSLLIVNYKFEMVQLIFWWQTSLLKKGGCQTSSSRL
jgi:hypothetical protein